MKKIAKLLVAGVLGGAALSAYAAPVLSYSVNSNNIVDLENNPGSTLDFTRFNASLGTLQSVQIELFSTFTGTMKLENKGRTGFTFTVTATEGLSLGLPVALNVSNSVTKVFGLSGYDGHADYAGTSGVTQSFAPPQYTNSQSYADALTLAAFTGAGTLKVGTTGATSATYVGSGNFNRSLPTEIDTRAVVTYNYVAAPVPEPETYAMMLAGLGLMGFVLRKRKAA
jgi:hypothetical protein